MIGSHLETCLQWMSKSSMPLKYTLAMYYDHQSEGYIILDPFFVNEHPNIKCLSYKLVKDKIVEASRRGLTTDIECDNYYLFDFANKITSVLQVEDPKLKTFTNESIFSALARFFVPQNFLKFDEHPHYTDTVLKAFAIHGLTDKVNELVEIETVRKITATIS